MLKTDLIVALSNEYSFRTIKFIIDKFNDSDIYDLLKSKLDCFSENNIAQFIPKHNKGHKILKYLIQKGLNVNTLCTSIDSNLLTICVYLDNYKCVKLLLENGADPSIKNKHNYSASFYSNNKQIVELFDKFSKKNESITLRLFKKEKSVEEIRMFLKYHTPSKQEFFHILVYIVTKNLSNYIDLLKEFDVHLSQFENEFNKYVQENETSFEFLNYLIKHGLDIDFQKIKLSDNTRNLISSAQVQINEKNNEIKRLKKMIEDNQILINSFAE